MERSNQIDEANQRKHEHAAGGPIAMRLQRVCHDTLPWLISFSLGCMRAFAVIFLLLAVVLAVDAARDQLSWNCRGFRSTVALLTVFFICSAAVDDIFGSRSQRFGGISRPYGIPVDSCGPL